MRASRWCSHQRVRTPSSSSPISSQELPIREEPDFHKSFFLSYMHRSDYDLLSLSSDAIISRKWLLFTPQILHGMIVHSAMGGIAPVSDRWFLTNPDTHK